jgi:F0F1-type ATP synthase delta subunit
MDCPFIIEEENDNDIISDSNEFDDSYIRQEDKKNLLIAIKKIYEKNYYWADEALMKCLIKNHYIQVIKNINKKDYLEEINKNDMDTILNQI